MPRAQRLLPTAAVAALALLALTLPQMAAAQNIYRSVDAHGRVMFSDRLSAGTPLPSLSPNGKNTSTEARTPVPQAQDGLPYALRQPTSRYPVTLYTLEDCPPCDAVRRMLVQRGIPYTERSVRTPADTRQLQRLSGQDQLPFATIGQQHLQGWEPSEWQRYLDLAGYPAQSLLPVGWQQAAATPLTPAAPSAPTAAASADNTGTGTGVATGQPAPEGLATAGTAPAGATRPPPRVHPGNPTGITF